jgi:hypothetical protein
MAHKRGRVRDEGVGIVKALRVRLGVDAMSSREDREQALAAALRENLRRRKSQARAAQDSASTDPVSGEPRKTR